MQSPLENFDLVYLRYLYNNWEHTESQELQGRKIHVRYAYERGGPKTFGGACVFGGRDGGYNLENPKF